MRDKRNRQAALLKVIQARPVGSQSEMVQFLRKSGFQATQASISRDARELGLVKFGGRYLPAARLAPRVGGAPANHEFELINSCEPVGANLVLVRTAPGVASAVAADLDRRQMAEVAGTLAGDDTIFVAVRSRSAQGRVLAALKGLGRP